MNVTQAVVLAAVFLFGVPFTALVYFVCRRLAELHREARTCGTLYVSPEREVFLGLEVNAEEVFDKRTVTLKVKKVKGGNHNVEIHSADQ